MSGVPPAAGGQLRLTLLGQLDLRRADGSEVRAVVQQPKRFALLAYLTLAGLGSWKRRDTLLGLFWPELDQEHARGALRRSLYFLRRACGDRALQSRGEEDVAVGPAMISCDALDFEAALDGGRNEEALQLYGGDLLDGFFISGAPEAERWLDGERRRLRQRAAAAAWSVAERAPAASAIPLARRAAALQPDDEDGIRRLMLLLDRYGDTSGAVRAFAELEERLRKDDLHPAHETAALAQRLRSRTTPRRNPVLREPTPIDPNVMAIVPFAVRGDPEVRYLGEGMLDLLANALDGAGTLRVCDPRSVLAAPVSDVGSSDAGDAESIGRELGAGWVVTGTIVAAGRRLRVTATLHRTGTGAVTRSEVEAPDEAHLFDAGDALARDLVAGMSREPSASRIAARTSASWGALKAFLTGEQAFRLAHYPAASQAFEHAVQIDPNFSLAWYRLGSVHAALAQVARARVANRQAMRHPERLSPHVLAMLEAQAAWLNGRLDEAERRYGAVIAEHPDDVEAHYLLGDVLFHGNPYRGRSPHESADAFRRALALDGAHPASLAKLARLAALEGDRALFGAYLDALAAASPEGDQTLALRTVQALTEGRMKEIGVVAHRLRSATTVAVARILGHAALHAEDLGPVERIGLEVVRRVPSRELRAFGLLLLAEGALAQGSWTRAEERWAEAGPLDAAWTLTHRTLRSIHEDSPAPASTLASLRRDLLAWDAADEPTRVAQPLVLHDGMQSHIKCYLLALIAARQGDGAEAARLAEELAELGVVEGAEAVIEQMLRMLEATRRHLHGDAEAALQALDGARTDVWFQHAVASPVYAGAESRLLRASLLRRIGRQREAVGWLMAIGQHSPWELGLRAHALFRAGAILLVEGMEEEARLALARARRQLATPDEAFAPFVQELEEELS